MLLQAIAVEAKTMMVIDYSHVKAHNGSPWHEAADFYAKSVLRGKVESASPPDFVFAHIDV